MITSTKQKYRYNETPHLSANQLADYLTASAVRRKGIIQEAKYGKVSAVARYDIAREAIKKHFTDPTRSHHILSNAIQNLTERENKADASSWIKEDSRCSIQSITAIQKAENKLGLNRFNFSVIASRQPPLIFDTVSISVTFDLMVHQSDRSGNKKVGAAIFIFSKSASASKDIGERGKIAATIAFLFAQKHLASHGEIDPKLCMAIDVFGGTVYPATGNYKRLLSNIEHSCKEIALTWPTIPEPADF